MAISSLTKKNYLFLQKTYEKNDIKKFRYNLTTNEFLLMINEISNNLI
jgi:hypothetical protein